MHKIQRSFAKNFTTLDRCQSDLFSSSTVTTDCLFINGVGGRLNWCIFVCVPCFVTYHVSILADSASGSPKQ